MGGYPPCPQVFWRFCDRAYLKPLHHPPLTLVAREPLGVRVDPLVYMPPALRCEAGRGGVVLESRGCRPRARRSARICKRRRPAGRPCGFGPCERACAQLGRVCAF